MPDAPDDPPFDEAVLDRAGQMLDDGLADGSIPEGRRTFLEALQTLQSGDAKEAARGFRRAARSAEPPFDALAGVARAECERLQGRVGSAIRHWREVAEDDGAPVAARYMSWASLAAVASDREDERLFEKARDAIRELEDSGEI